MVVINKYYLQPTALVPNSKYPLLHYVGVLPKDKLRPEKLHNLYKDNGWETQWIFRYGPTQDAHYHSRTHECMIVLTGTATIRFGVADTDPDLEKSTHGDAYEKGGVTLSAKAGDAFLIPAGVSHKTHNTSDNSTFKLLTPGGGHKIEGDVEKQLAEIELSGYTMLGAYPVGGEWDFAIGGEDEGNYKAVWDVPKPPKDPLLGNAKEGLCGQWDTVKAKL